MSFALVFASIFLLIIILFFIFEIRIRRPDQIVLSDVNGQVRQKKGRFYARHFSLAVPSTILTSTLELESEAQGKLPVKIKLSLTTAADEDHLTELVRTGGWNVEVVQKASKELGLFVQSLANAFCEKREIEELSSKDLHDFLLKQLSPQAAQLGLKLIGVNIQSIEPVDPEIAEAMQQQEAARIQEKTEKTNQNARLEAAKIRLEVEDNIRKLEHQLQLQELERKQAEQEREAQLARFKVEQELERRKLQFSQEQAEMEVFEKHPELLLLSPQLARLAEASQQLKNARTVVSLSGLDGQKGNQIFELFEQFLQKVLKSSSGQNK